MAHKHVSNKATFKNEGFLSMLSSSLMTRRAPPPEQMDTHTTLTWHKTSEVKERIKTATGTIAVYSDMTLQEVEALKESVAMIPTLEEAQRQEQEMKTDIVVSSVVAEAATMAVKSFSESTAISSAKSTTIFIALDDYLPDTNDGFSLVSGQKVELIDAAESASKKLRIEPEDGVQLLDNSAAKHKMSIRPRKNHPNRKATKESQVKEERWLVKDVETGLQGYVPAKLLGAAPVGAIFATSIKRSLQEMSAEESMEVKRKLTKEMKEIKSSKLRKSSSRLLGPSPEEEARAKRTATIKELIETEEEFVKDLEFVMENYYALLDNISTPKRISDQKDVIFGNFKYIAEFHQNVLIEGVKFHAEVPSLIGKTFLRLERDFDKHSEYCSSEPMADEFLESNPDIKDFFEEFSDKIDDDKRLQEHLKLPIQRLNDYQLLLKEIIKFSNRLGDETKDLERAHDLMQTIPQRATDAKFLASIEGYKGNLFKLGRLIRHDWFSVSEVGHKTRDRYLFLFKARILITKVKRITEDRSIFVLRDIIRLPETSLCGLERPNVLEFHHIEPQNHPNFPIAIEARTPEIRNAWLEVVQEHVIDTASVDDLLFDDEIRVVSEEAPEEEQGHISPLLGDEDFVEDLPEDIDVDQVVPEAKDIEIVHLEEPTIQIESELRIEEVFEDESKPVERIIPIEVEDKILSPEVESSKRTLEKEEEFDFFGDKDFSPPPKKRVHSPPQEVLTAEDVNVSGSVPAEEPKQEELEQGVLKEEQEETNLYLEASAQPKALEEFQVPEEEIKQEPQREEPKEKQETKSEESVQLNLLEEPKVFEEEVKKEVFEEEEKKKPKEELTQVQEEAEKQPIEPCKPKLFEELKVPEEAESALLEPPTETKPLSEVTAKRPKEEVCEEVDFWSTRESSPPLKRLATPQSKELTPPASPQIGNTKQDLKLEQVEISAKAEEKVAEQSQQLKLEAEEDFGKKVSRKFDKEELSLPAEKEFKPKEETASSLSLDIEHSKESEERLVIKDIDSRREIKQDSKKEPVTLEKKEPEKKKSFKKQPIEDFGKGAEISKKDRVEDTTRKESIKLETEKKEFKRSDSDKQQETTSPAVKDKEEEYSATENATEKESGRKGTLRKKSYERTIKKSLKKDSVPSNEEPLKVDTLTKEPTLEKPLIAEQFPSKIEEKETLKVALAEEHIDTELGEEPPKTESLKKDKKEPEKDLKRKESEKKGPVKKKSKTESSLESSLKDQEPKQILAEAKPEKPIHQEGPRNLKTETASMEPSPAPGAFGSKPVFTKSLAGDVVEPGDGATFVCEVDHPEAYYVSWLKDNKVLNDRLADRVLQSDEGNKHILRLMNCKTEDSGIYTAKATDNYSNSATCSAQLLVQELTPEEREKRIAEKKPFFLVKMIQTEVIENTKLSYAVHAKGDPMPVVTFYKDKAPLKEDDRVTIRRDAEHGKYELVIGHVHMSDAGVYKCVAMNKYDKAECEAAMTVAEEKKALANLSGKGSLLKPGEKAEFKWFRDGIEFDPVERFNVMFKDEEDTLALVFQNVTPDDAGIYTCVASTSCGKISCSAELTVEGSIHRLMKDPEPPAMKEELSDTYVALTGTAMLECRVSGYPKPELTWTCNGVDVKLSGRIKQLWEDDEGVTLIIKNVTENDKGVYHVKAKNDLGQAESSCNLMLRSVPKFRKVEKLIGCDVGKPLVYSVEVDGEPLPELKWLKDGKVIEPSEHVKFESTPDGKFTMKIDKMKPEDCGAYSIIATNDIGQRAEQFEIQAETPPEVTRGFDVETEKKAGNDHTFEIRAKGNPLPVASWYKNGKELADDHKYQIWQDGNFYMLRISDITRADRGTYKIVLTNRNGKAESEGNFLVRGPPEFTTPVEDACAKEGSKDVKLFVEWDSNPRPTVKWFFKDKIIHEETPGFCIKSTDITSVLVIYDAAPDFVGVYTVQCSNEYGDRSCSARFRLHEPPQLLEPLKDVEFLEDTRCKFQCKVSGVPIPDIKWTKDGSKWNADEKRVITKKDGEEVYMLIFESAKTEDSGKYTAVLSNVEGKVTTEGSIIVNTPPHIAGSSFREGITLIAMHKFVLEVEATAVPEAVATWYLNGKELKEEQDSVKFSFDGKVYRMERIGSDPEHSGEYKCKLKNKIKEVDEVGTVTVIEKESRVRQGLKHVNVKEKTDGVIQCQIVGDPIPTVEWFRNGKPLTPTDRIEIREDREKRMHYLIFKDVDEDDKSTFTLKGKNEHGECETSCVMTIFVVPRPGELQDTVVDFGRDLLLSVHVHAIPIPEVTWFKDGKKLEESDRVFYIRDEKNEIYSMKITSVVLEDGAIYTYTAKNEVGECSGKSVVKIHTEKPTIVTELRSMNICLEDEVTFSIKYAGLPPPVVEWRNKGVLVNTAERYTTVQRDANVNQITLKDLQITDYGMITGTAKNLVGEAVSTAELTQKKLACEVIEGLENVTKGAEGEGVSLTAAIKGSPRPAFVWTKDGDVVESSANIKLAFKKTSYCEATISLTILMSSSNDSGQYRLRFFNEVNEAQTETALIVKVIKRKPKISNLPGSIEVSEMDPGILKCRISGCPKPEVKWLKDGRIVRPTDILNSGMTANGEYFLEFKNITREDAGKYTVVAENDEGRVQSDVILTVNPSPSKPKFVAGLKPTKVIVGYPCRMEVQLDGFPKPKVAWVKNGKPVEIDGNHIREIFTDDGRVILQIDNATESDAGDYAAVAKNDLGENSSSATLSVLDHERKDGQPDGPPVFGEGLKDGYFDEGKAIRLPVSVRGGPVPDMKWFKDGKEVKLGGRVFYTYDGDKTYLEIHPCVGADSGKYKCVIENPNGNAETECDVTVRKCFEPPSFTYLYPNQQQLPGGDAKFTIKLDGVPKPEVTWFFNGKKITADGEKYRVRKDADGYTLFVRETTYGDSGKYKVVACNQEGTAEHEASLLVADDVDPTSKSEPPNILKTIGDQELYEGYTAKFKAVVSGRPQPEFEWLRNGVKLFPNNRIISEMDEDGLIRLTIKHVSPEDAGIYELKVWNEHGKASCKGKLICECISKHKKRPIGDEYKGFNKVKHAGVPIPLSDKPIISALSDRRCTLSWLPYISSSVSAPVTYQVEICECPEGDWVTTSRGIRGCSVDILNLSPKSDYKFRVRVENKFGVSEPSPYVTTFRNRLERDPISYEPFLEPSDEFPVDGPYVPPGFRIDRDIHGNFSAPPRFLKLDHDTQYGKKNFSGRVKWIAYGYPTPKLRFYFKDEEIRFTKGGRYTYTHEPNGEIYLFIDRIDENDVGWYKCEAFNEYGESQQRIRLGLSEYPRVLQHLQETYIRGQGSGRIYCRISAYPPCDVKWFKDWHEIKPSIKMKPQFIESDMYCLNFNGLSGMDSGLYSIAAVNVAGAVSSSCMVHVEDDEATYNWYGHVRGKHIGINTRRGTLEDHYDIGDELGRGTQGVTYHCSERHSGRNFAAKSMWGKDQFKTWMHMEYDMMNFVNSSKRVVRLFDAYEGPKNMVLVMELCSGGELLQSLTRNQYITEYEVSFYIRQILEGLEYMHDRWIAHLGLNIGDIMVTRPNGTDIKIGDLSLARNIRLNKLQPLEYGMPEFVAPEVVKLENVTYAADMWAVGVIAYLLLSGTSPFRGEHDRETLTRIQNGELRFDFEAFSNLSDEAKDFIAKLLQYNPEHRMDVKGALAHPWMRFGDMSPLDPYKISTDRLRTYYSKYKDWYSNASCRRWYRRRPLVSAFTHPSKMVYPPGEIYTPPVSPEREVVPVKQEDYLIHHRDLSYEIGLIKSDSHYQQGPDTYLLQLRDTDFPVRVRKYMNIARERSPIAMFTGRDTGYDYDRIPVVHERRRFTDIMDEEIEDERRRTMVDKYSADFVRTKQNLCSLDLPRRVKREVTSRYTIRDEAEAIKLEKDDSGKAPFIREKPPSTAITPNMSLTLTCVVTGDPEPSVQWFRNDIILCDTSRIAITYEEERSQLIINECRDFDVGFYKIVARNGRGQATHRFRLVRGEIPGMCDPPEKQDVSGTQILLKWRPPIDDGAAAIEFYHLQIKAMGEAEWTSVSESIPQELFLVEQLTPNTVYQFRVSARNIRGWGEFSVSTPGFKTGGSDDPTLPLPVEQQLQKKNPKLYVLQLPGARGEIRDLLDYGREIQNVPLKTGDGAVLQMRKYRMVNEISRGRFSSIMRCVRQDDQRTFACKIFLSRGREEAVTKEYEMAKSLRHERLATMYEAYRLPEVATFIIEYLGGPDVLVFFANKLQYTEQNVCVVLNQVLDGISYLHWRGFCHLDLQPDNVVVTSPNKLDVKLVDFGSAHRVARTGSPAQSGTLLDFNAPEILFEKKAYPNSDVWSVGVLTYVLLTGLSPFLGQNEEETLENIQCVRFKFEPLGELASQEATRFLMLILKRDPSKRPTEEECIDHKWLGENDFMVKKRERALLSTQRLREYSDSYHKRRENQASKSNIFSTFMNMC